MTPEPPTATSTPNGTPMPVAQILVATPSTTSDCSEPEAADITALLGELQSCTTDLSSFTKDVIRLYLELQEFKDDPEFHQVGFSLCCPVQRVEKGGRCPNRWRRAGNVGGDWHGPRRSLVPWLGVFAESGPLHGADRLRRGQHKSRCHQGHGPCATPAHTDSIAHCYGRSKRQRLCLSRPLRPAPTQAPTPTPTADAAKELEMDDYILSDSGVKVWKTPDAHSLLRHTDTTHPWFLDKLAETYSRGKVRGLPRILSENSEDARTWYYFSPLLSEGPDRAQVLERLVRQAFPGAAPSQVLDSIRSSELIFWPKLSPPPSRPQREGTSEPDILIRLGKHGVVLIEAKYRSDVSERTTHDETRDQVIRLIDIGSWYARQENLRDPDTGHYNSYVVVLQYGGAETNAEEVVDRYKGKPDAIEKALSYRSDLTYADYQRLASSVAFVRWPDPLNGQ